MTYERLIYLQITEAVVRRCSSKQVFFKISFSCEYCEIFSDTFFHRTPPVDASEIRTCILAVIFNKMAVSGGLNVFYQHSLANQIAGNHVFQG